jgi:hypothetical protein
MVAGDLSHYLFWSGAHSRHRCVLTGSYDWGSLQKISSVEALAIALGQAPVSTRVAYIIPESMNAGIPEDEEGYVSSTCGTSVINTMHDQLHDAMNRPPRCGPS